MPAARFTATYTSTDLAGARHPLLRHVSHHATAGQALRWLGRLLRAGGTQLDRSERDHRLEAFTDNDAFHRVCFRLNNGTPLRIQHRAGRRVVTVAVTNTVHWRLLPASPEPPREVRRAALVRSRTAAARSRCLRRAEGREQPEHRP
ncbi:hypothetical protein ACFXPX_43270 [Kitasatospora sp. NPDC059146]|uniref:hypothetical protein n=1 Tax=unclassified Kitasatospora TaxID=2633591 RepID=UPI0036C776CE